MSHQAGDALRERIAAVVGDEIADTVLNLLELSEQHITTLTGRTLTRHVTRWEHDG